MDPHCFAPAPTLSAFDAGGWWYHRRHMVGVSDGELARLVVTGDGRRMAAEAELCQRFAPRIRLYGLKHLGNEDRARDLVQSVLVAVLEALRAGRVDDIERVDRFMLGTCRNLALRVRAEDKRTTPTEAEELDVRSFLPDEPLDIVALFRCMGELPLRTQSILQLSFFRDKSADEIAHVLATTPGNVRVVRHRAMAQLRECLEGHGP